MNIALRIGIDLGTTFSCVAALDERGHPVIVSNSLGQQTTPSVLWFDGREAVVGHCAYAREVEEPGFLVTFVKRNTGKPAQIPPELYDRRDAPETAPYPRGGYNWGVEGMQALLLRALCRDALAHFRRTGQVSEDIDDDSIKLYAVVTVPAYFRDIEREQTRRAAEAAGLHVLGVINEPTAAALAYRLVLHGKKRLFVFDLGGGTFDVTILDLHADGRAEVLASEGNPELGGIDWDDLLYRYFREEIILESGEEPDAETEFTLRLLATQAKIALTNAPCIEVALLLANGKTHKVTLHRTTPPGYNPIFDLDDDTFYFETKATDLLTQIRSICQMALDAANLTTAGGTQPWVFIDEVIMVGGSCRMPMIPGLLEEMSNGRHEVCRHPEGFDFDTAVAIGAALYALQPDRVRDVSPGTYGIKLKSRKDDRYIIYHLIHKNARLPITVEREFEAGANAVLELYQGDSTVVADCVRRGRLELNNPEGTVRVILHMDGEGTLSVACMLPDGERRTVTIQNEFFGFDARTTELAERVHAVTLKLCTPIEGENHALVADVAERISLCTLASHEEL